MKVMTEKQRLILLGAACGEAYALSCWMFCQCGPFSVLFLLSVAATFWFSSGVVKELTAPEKPKLSSGDANFIRLLQVVRRAGDYHRNEGIQP